MSFVFLLTDRRLDLQDDLWRYSWHRVWAWHRVILHLATAGWKLLESRYKLRINCNLILQWRRNKWKCLVVEPWSTRRNVSGTTQLVIHSFFIKKKEKCLETMLATTLEKYSNCSSIGQWLESKKFIYKPPQKLYFPISEIIIRETHLMDFLVWTYIYERTFCAVNRLLFCLK